MAVELALYQPDIARNTGQLLRLGACLGVPVHIIHPTGFPLTRRELKPGSLDYLDRAEMVEHDSYEHFDAWRRREGRRLVLLTTRASISSYDAGYAAGDILMAGRESIGVPDVVAAAADLRVRIPMLAGLRSLNVSLAATMVLGEALRQTKGFADLT